MFETKVLQRLAIAGVIAMSVVVGGCATKPNPSDEAAVQAYKEANDPFEPMNRYFFSVNMFIDEMLLKPFAGYYNIALPQVAKDGVRGLLRNINTPVILANDLFQGEGHRAGITAERFAINTFLGGGGLYDTAAKHFNLPYHDEDFGQTMAVWGAGEGPYLMIPLLGPSNPRDATGKIVDKFLDPLTYVGYIYNVGYINTIRGGLEAIDTRSRNLQAVEDLKKGSIDFYATVRSLYRQHRNDEIRNGRESDNLTPGVTSEMTIPADKPQVSSVQ